MATLTSQYHERNTTILSREKRMRLFSIDCPSEIVFSNWKPDGRVYTKPLKLKNVGNQLITLTYKLPELSCFFTPFPDYIVLPVGMEHVIQVSFQPVNAVEVESTLVLHSNQYNEDFILRLRGDLPTLSCATPLKIDFTEKTAVCEQNSETRVLTNDGEVPLLFDFQYDKKNLLIEPPLGGLEVGYSTTIKYTFMPDCAGQFCERVMLTIKKAGLELLAKTDSVTYNIELVAVAKFPFLKILVNDFFYDVIRLEDVPILSSREQQCFIVNQSEVRTAFELDDSICRDFPYNQVRITPSRGVIEKGQKAAITIRYDPGYCGGFYKALVSEENLTSDKYANYDEIKRFTEYDPQQLSISIKFIIKTASKAFSAFTVLASARPIDLQLSHSKVELGAVKCGYIVQQSLYLKNNSKFATPYEIVCPGIIGFKGVAVEAHVDTQVVYGENSDDLSRPRVRKLQGFPFAVIPQSGIAKSEISQTLYVVLDLRRFTCQSNTIQAQNELSYIPPQPIHFMLYLKVPGAPVYFISVTATLLPEKSDCRPAPIVMKYAEAFYRLSMQYTLDEMLGVMLPYKNEPAMPMNSVLFNYQNLLEFETEWAEDVHLWKYSLVREVDCYTAEDVETAPFTNALLPSDSILYEFEFRFGKALTCPVILNYRKLNFNYVPHGSESQQIFTVYNTTEKLNMFLSMTATENFKCCSVEFLGIADSPFFSGMQDLQSITMQEHDGLDYTTALTKGMVVKIPPEMYGFFYVTFRPSQPDEVFFAKLGLFCVAQPLLMYRCFRHCVVPGSFIYEVRVCGTSRSQQEPALISSMPNLSRPVINNKVKMPPAAPGSFSRQTFAFTNYASTFITITLSRELYQFMRVYPEVCGLDPGQTCVFSIGFAWPVDSITNKEKYGFTTNCDENSVLFEDSLDFLVNGSQNSMISIAIYAVCVGISLALEKVGCNEMLIDMSAAPDDAPQRIINMRMAPVSLGSETARNFAVYNKSLLPCQFLARCTNQADEALMFVNPNDFLMRGCENVSFAYTLHALEVHLREQAYSFKMDLFAEIPQHLSVPSPKYILLNTNLQFDEAPIHKGSCLCVHTSVTKRTISLAPETVNLGPIVPYQSVDIPIVIYNSSHCSISYTLEVHEIFEGLPRLEGLERDFKPARKYLYEQARDNGDFLVPALFNRLYDSESVMTTVKQQRCPQVFIKSGAGAVILPQSEGHLTVTVTPFSTKTVRARVYAKIVEIEASGRKMGEIVSQLEARATYVQGTATAIQHILDYQNEVFECRIEVTADHPRFIISDVSCPKIGSSQIRDIMEVDYINEFLTDDVSLAERVYVTPCGDRDKIMNELIEERKQYIRFAERMRNTEDALEQEYDYKIDDDDLDEAKELQNDGSEAPMDAKKLNVAPPEEAMTLHDFTTNAQQNQKELQYKLFSPYERMLYEFPIVLGPDNRSDSKQYRINLTLANPGILPAHITVELPREIPDQESCPWANALPSMNQQRTMSLLARRIFTVSPEELVLYPGQKHSLQLTYSHQEEGVHELIVLVKITGGRSFFFHLIGQTLAESEPALIAPVEFKLMPVAVSEPIPPRQFLKMSNPGSVPVRFTLLNCQLLFNEQTLLDYDGGDMEGLEQDPRKIFKILNPSGYIAANSSTVVVLQFQPSQVGLVRCYFDLLIDTCEKMSALDCSRQAHYFASECTMDLPEDVLGDAKDYRECASMDIVRECAAAFEHQLEEHYVYQTLALAGYGFYKYSLIPVSAIPSHQLEATPVAPAAGAVSLLEISRTTRGSRPVSFAARADTRSLAFQRGLGICTLSCGRLVFGAVPIFSEVRSIISLTAAEEGELTQFGSAGSGGLFKWRIRNPAQFRTAYLHIEFYPDQGTLLAGQKQQIRVSVSTGAIPSCFLEDVPFEVEFIPNMNAAALNQPSDEQLQRLPVVLANTVASAARVSETAILQQFDPSEKNKAGLDQAGRHAHAMLYGVDDRVSYVRSGPLSYYASTPLNDVLWLTVTLHSHKYAALPLYENCDFGLQRNLGIFERQAEKAEIRVENEEIQIADYKRLERLVAASLKAAVGRIVSEPESYKELLRVAESAPRNALNGLYKANFFHSKIDDPVKVIDLEGTKREFGQVGENRLVEMLGNILYDYM